MALRLTLLAAPPVPLEVEGVTPENIAGKSIAEVEKIEVFLGNRKEPLAEFFRVEGDVDGEQIDWEGDLSGVHWIGAEMTRGTIRVDGAVGRHLGSEMTGGTIEVEGDASDWVGGEMHGGLIHVHGRAGHLIGAAYRGSARGMTGGTLLIDGAAGNEIGHTMRRGLIAIGGDVGDLIGFNMLAGTILIQGECGIRHGAGMRRGTIGLFGAERPPMLPTFKYSCRFRPPMMSLLAAELRRHGFDVCEPISTGDVDLYHGDMLDGGRGEILLPAA